MAENMGGRYFRVSSNEDRWHPAQPADAGDEGHCRVRDPELKRRREEKRRTRTPEIEPAVTIEAFSTEPACTREAWDLKR
jgi:hypothetical protein